MKLFFAAIEFQRSVRKVSDPEQAHVLSSLCDSSSLKADDFIIGRANLELELRGSFEANPEFLFSPFPGGSTKFTPEEKSTLLMSNRIPRNKYEIQGLTRPMRRSDTSRNFFFVLKSRLVLCSTCAATDPLENSSRYSCCSR